MPVDTPAVPAVSWEPTEHAPHPLGWFFAGLEAAEHGSTDAVEVLHLGASHTAADRFTGRLRLRLQERFGDAGRGLAHPGLGTDEDFFQEGMTWATEGAWTAWRGTRKHAIGPFGVGGVRLQSDEPLASWSRGTVAEGPIGTTFDGFVIDLLRTPGGGSFVVYVDGLEVSRHATALTDEEVATLRALEPPRPPERPLPDGLPVPPDVGLFATVSHTVADAPHLVEVELVGDGPVSFLGMSTTRAVPGVRYSALGISGSRADQFLDMPEAAVVQEVARVAPSLLVLHWGINETTMDRWYPDDRTAPVSAWIEAAAGYADVAEAMVARLRKGAPDASCLLLLPTDLATRDHPAIARGTPKCLREETSPLVPDGTVCVRPHPPSQDGIREALRVAATRADCATWDAQRAMGGAGSIDLWRSVTPALAATDGIHLTTAGYRLLADALAADLLDAYAAWVRGETPPAALDKRTVDVGAWVHAAR